MWRSGDKALAGIHLALAGLPTIEPDDAYRLFLADLALDGGVPPAILLREIGGEQGDEAVVPHFVVGRVRGVG